MDHLQCGVDPALGVVRGDDGNAFVVCLAVGYEAPLALFGVELYERR